MKLLATGFGPFPGAPFNPTAWLMEDLRGWSPPGTELVTHVLGVHYDVWSELSPILDTHRPDAIVAFGLSAKATGITLERLARNSFDAGRPDARGDVPARDRSDAEGPATYESDLAMAVSRALAHPHAGSDDAGAYICNLTLYRLLASGRRAMFVHVAPLERMPEADLRAGARAVLETVARVIG